MISLDHKISPDILISVRITSCDDKPELRLHGQRRYHKVKLFIIQPENAKDSLCFSVTLTEHVEIAGDESHDDLLTAERIRECTHTDTHV